MDEKPARRELERDEGPEGPYVPERDAEGRELVESAPVVGPFPSPDSFTPEQQRKIGEVYIRIAQELPTEGRDYTVKFTFPDPAGNPTVAFRPMTELGRDYVRHLARAMRSPGKEH